MLELRSEAFRDADSFPRKFTQEGENVSPPLSWTHVGPSVQEFALICEDPDAPRGGPYVHWLIYGIPREVNALPEGIPPKADLKKPIIAKQGRNSAGDIGFSGPMPPTGHGWHRYYFRLFALDKKLELKSGLTYNELLEAIRNNVVGEAEIMGRYQRPMPQPEQIESHSAQP